MSYRAMSPVAVLLLVSFHGVQASFDVSMWNLRTFVTQQTSAGQISDADDITQITNPLLAIAHARLDASVNESSFHYTWNNDSATGQFNTGFMQAIRAIDVHTVSRGQIFILADEPLRLSIEGAVTYAHTPGDDSSVLFGVTIRDMAAGQYVFQQVRHGGFAHLQPASASLSLLGEQLLDPGVLYRLEYALDCHNIADPLPSGILDANGEILLGINPIPEPSSLALLALGIPLLVRRRRMPFA